MTRLIFIPDENTLIVMESPLTADELMHSIHSGLWSPPTTSRMAGLQPTEGLQATRIGSVVIASYPPHLSGKPARSRNHTANLSRRQQQVLQGIADGLTTRQIAARLNLHPRTVQMHIDALKTRLGARNLAQSVRLATGLGLYPLEDYPQK